MQELILVDEENRQVGTSDMLGCHLGDGILHRAFTVFVFDGKKRVLIQRRSKGKLLWPLTWETSCSGHPVVGEDLAAAAEKRLEQEIGISVELKTLGKFRYQASYEDRGSENEICFVLAGDFEGTPQPDPREVFEYRWVGLHELKEDIDKDRDDYAPWLIRGLGMLAGMNGR